jgi:hypothetical protein
MGQCFLGVYSNRVGKLEELQLGVVWKERVVEEIIKGGQIGQDPRD